MERATTAIDAYLDAIAPRFDGSVTWSRSSGEQISGAGVSRIDLR